MDSQPNDKKASGQLFVVATPIGNLADITYRAVETLKNVDIIAAEDTRTSRRLCERYAINTPMIACHEHNETAVGHTLLARLQAGENIALISDAGTPLISDPGFKLVRELRRHGILITPIPGPCSPIAALSACGLPTDRFIFSGFLSRSGKSRKQRLDEIASGEITHIILESPKRLLHTLDTLIEHCGAKRQICVAREITKLHETFVHGTLDEVRNRMGETSVRGEIVIIIGPGKHTTDVSDAEIMLLLKRTDMEAMSPPERAKQLAKMLRIPRSRAYALLMQDKAGNA